MFKNLTEKINKQIKKVGNFNMQHQLYAYWMDRRKLRLIKASHAFLFIHAVLNQKSGCVFRKNPEKSFL